MSTINIVRKLILCISFPTDEMQNKNHIIMLVTRHASLLTIKELYFALV